MASESLFTRADVELLRYVADELTFADAARVEDVAKRIAATFLAPPMEEIAPEDVKPQMPDPVECVYCTNLVYRPETICPECEVDV